MGKGLTAALCLLVLTAQPAHAEVFNLRGHWEIRIPSMPNYSGTALVDAERRTTWDDGAGHGWRGYVARADASGIEFITTSGRAVAHTRCTIESSDLLHCQHQYVDGSKSVVFVLTRVGLGPQNLMLARP